MSDRLIAFRLVGVSFLVLFTELVLIRWLGAQILYLSYFSNVILLASFLGIGVGVLAAKKQFSAAFLFPFLLIILVSLIYPSIGIRISGGEVLYFQGTEVPRTLGQIPVIIGVFLIVAAIMVVLAQELGRLLDKLPPLAAYAWDIAGALAGIALFTLLAFLRASALWWFGIILVTFFLLHFEVRKYRFWIGLAFSALFFVSLILLNQGSLWSPYYQLRVLEFQYPDSAEVGYLIRVNQIGHQTIEPLERLPFIYQVPYDFFASPKYENALIIGAGAGSDTAVALERGVGAVDAVEIDPEIAKIGKELNPLRPYFDPRVSVYVNDGRNFLEKTEKRYDLIIYALTDSLTLASSYANTRLESYLFTKEAFSAVKNHLSDKGLFVMYNYYREPWLIQKYLLTLEQVFGSKALAFVDGPNFLGAIAVGPKTAEALKPANFDSTGLNSEKLEAATDDWPFPYLKHRSFPSVYLGAIAIFLIVSFLTVYFLQFRFSRGVRKFDWHFFFLGGAFLLLETKSVIQFNLLFGATWLVNALVFFAILGFVLLAIFVAKKFPRVNSRLLYVVLGLSLLGAYFLPLQSLLGLNPILRYGIASIVTFLPVFLANLVFASSFRDTKDNSLSFGSNLVGAMCGGCLEYTAMLFGYHFLILVVLVWYVVSLVFMRRPVFAATSS